MMPRRFLATLFPAKVPGGRALTDDTQVILYIVQDQFVPFSLFRLKHNLVAVELIHYVVQITTVRHVAVSQFLLDAGS